MMTANMKTLAQDLPDGLTVAVLYGGDSHERSISLQSGQAVVQALQSSCNVKGIDTAGMTHQQILDVDCDIYFIALHGGVGENGKLQELLQQHGKKFTGSNATASKKAFNKHWSKLIWQEEGLPVADWQLIHASRLSELNLNASFCQLGQDLFVKPSRQGSSMGCSAVKADSTKSSNAVVNLQQALQHAESFDNQLLIEKMVDGAEYTVAILANQTLPMVKIEPANDFYDFEAKYGESPTQYITELDLPSYVVEKGQAIAMRAFALLGCCGWGRVDLMYDRCAEQWVILELNIVPGLTSRSLVPIAAKQMGLDYAGLLTAVLNLGLATDHCDLLSQSNQLLVDGILAGFEAELTAECRSVAS